jgi:succinate-semialdehyde dehydrogenase/glutarate-semialdehyde dehydrogenase
MTNLDSSLLSSPLVKSGSYINGNWLSDSTNTFAVLNPANGEKIATLASASAEHATLAVDAASLALLSWRNKSVKERSKLLRCWFDLVIKNKQELAEILTAEQGKPLAESLGEIIYGANYIEWFAEEAKRVYGDTIPAPSADKRIVVIKQPIGVVSAITPWNFPSSMITRKAAPALAAGCTFIVKAATETPLSALALAELAHQAGIPPGVFNVIVSNQARPIGHVLTGDSRIAKFSFTGSTPVGKTLLKQCADTVKKTTMELGGNAPFIVFDDADLDAAVAGAIISKFRNAGQTCVCSNRMLVQKGVYEEFAKRFVVAVEALNVGEGTSEGVNVGPLIHSAAANDVATLVSEAVAAGAKVLTGGKKGDLGDNFYQPTVLSNVDSSMSVAVNEIFGPVAPLIEFETDQQAIDIANDTDFGLASYIYTRDIGRVWRVSEALEYGMVGVNEGIISNEMAPFGGIKQSGMGREGSKYGIEDFLEIKYICMGGINS